VSGAFDPVAAAQTYAAMETEELVRIAYLEPDYVPEAKALAVRELDKRGVAENRESLIRQVRDENMERAHAVEMHSARKFQQAHALELRLIAGMLIGFLWFAALLAPSIQKDLSRSGNGLWFVVLSVWAIAIVDGVRKWRRGLRRQLYLVAIIPGALFVVGVAFRWVTQL
jgi:hypothetical protein